MADPAGRGTRLSEMERRVEKIDGLETAILKSSASIPSLFATEKH
jgi:hypothetical protein